MREDFIHNDATKLISLMYVARLNCQHLHWNYVGENFIEIHKYADENLAVIDDYIDKVVEDMKQQNIYVMNPLVYIINNESERLNNIADNEVNEYYIIVDELIDFIMTINYDLNVTMENILEELLSELGKIRWFLRATFSDLITI